MLSAFCFNLDQSEILSSGNGLRKKKLSQQWTGLCTKERKKRVNVQIVVLPNDIY